MKNTKSEKRFQGIVELVKVSGYATTEELSSAFNVSQSFNKSLHFGIGNCKGRLAPAYARASRAASL